MDLGIVWVSVIIETLQPVEIYRDSHTERLSVGSQPGAAHGHGRGGCLAVWG